MTVLSYIVNFSLFSYCIPIDSKIPVTIFTESLVSSLNFNNRFLSPLIHHIIFKILLTHLLMKLRDYIYNTTNKQ